MKVSRGEQKTSPCQICSTVFSKTRYDQKFCSAPCREKAKAIYNRAKWFDRPDRELQNQQRRVRYCAQRPEVLAAQKQWRVDHPEEARIKDRAKYERNKTKHIARSKSYRAAHPELRHREYHNARKKRPWKQSLANAHQRAVKKGFAFDLTREWCEKIWTGKCAKSGLPFLFGTQTHFPFSPSIDRIDSSKGYVQDNCRFVLFAVNSFKGTGTDEQMVQIARAIVQLHEAPDKL